MIASSPVSVRDRSLGARPARREARPGHPKFAAHEVDREFRRSQPSPRYRSELHCFPFANQDATFFALCRRHNLNYADVRIMPMFSWTWCLT
jgi:hypothetical protein